MAEIIPDEGLDLLLGQFPKNSTRQTSCWLCLFTSQTASTVITSGQTMADITETVFTNYARQELTTATWGAVAAGTGGRKTTYSQITFPTVGATGATINGLFLSDILSTTGDKCEGAADFADGRHLGRAADDDHQHTPPF